MKVILLHDVPGLGQPGDVKDVANGYARNFLLPRQLVTAATPGALKNLQEQVSAAKRRVERLSTAHKQLAERLSGVTLTFAVHVGRGDRLYGSITNQNIADALLEQEGLRIDRRTINLPDPLRQLGTFEVPVRVASGVEPRVKVAIVSATSVAAGTTAASGSREATLVPGQASAPAPQEAAVTADPEAVS
ncbi:MAG: hypothetical protein PVSMB4_04980 [Ktedonobacterales bacterium]